MGWLASQGFANVDEELKRREIKSLTKQQGQTSLNSTTSTDGRM